MLSAYAEPIGNRWGLRTMFALRSAYPLVSDTSAATWVHVAYEGEWNGHHTGAFKLTRALFEQCIRNFEAQANPAPLYFGHEDVRAAMAAASEPEAKGWIHKLEIRDVDGKAHLWAFTEFGDDAAAGAKRGGWKFCSGVFDFEGVDRVTAEPIGCQLLSLALCGRPFLDGQTPIELSQRAALAAGDPCMYTKKQALEALDLMKGSEFDMEQFEQVLAGLAAQAGKPKEPEPPEMSAPALAAPAAPAAPLAEPTPAAPMAEPGAADPAMADAGAMMIAKLTAALPGMDAAAILAALEANIDKVAAVLKAEEVSPGDSATLSDELAATRVTVKSLSERLKRFEDQDAKRVASEKAATEAKRKLSAETRVDTLINGGRLLSTGREKMIALAMRDESAFADLELSLAAAPPTATHASGTSAIDLDGSAPETVADDDPAIKPLCATLKGARDAAGKILTAEGQVALAKQLIAQRRADERRTNGQAPRA